MTRTKDPTEKSPKKRVGPGHECRPSMELYRLCLHTMRTRSETGKVRAQDVGALLGFSPSDTTHWKMGTRSVLQVAYLQNICQGLGLPYSVVWDVAQGYVTAKEGLLDIVQGQELQSLQDHYKGQWPQVYRALLAHVGQWERHHLPLLQKEPFTTPTDRPAQAPWATSVPAFASHFPGVHLVASADMVGETVAQATKSRMDHYVIRYHKALTPYTRLALMQEVVRVLCLLNAEGEEKNPSWSALGLASNAPAGLEQYESRLIAQALLLPRYKWIAYRQAPATLAPLTWESWQHRTAQDFAIPHSMVNTRLTTLGALPQMGFVNTAALSATLETPMPLSEHLPEDTQNLWL